MSQLSRVFATTMASRRTFLLGMAVGCLAIAGAIAAGSPIAAQSVPTRSVIAFNQAEPDAVVEAFVLRYNLRTEAVYLWTAGFSGTHRDSTSTSVTSLLAGARRQSASLFANAIRSGRQGAATFTSSHVEDEVVSSAALTTEARSIVNNHAQLHVALVAARSQVPFIYAVEVVGASTSDLTRVSRDPLVSAVATRDGPKTAGRLKPAEYQIAQKDPAIAGLGARQAYAQLRALAKTGTE